MDKQPKSLNEAILEKHLEKVKSISDEKNVSMTEWVGEIVEDAIQTNDSFNESCFETENTKSDDKGVYIERTTREDLEQLEAIDFILENLSYIHYPNEPVNFNFMSIDELYDLYSCAGNPELRAYPKYKMSDLIDLLTSEEYDIRESCATNGRLSIFWES